MIKGIIFDLDGVLVHTDEMHYRAWKQVADRLCIAFDREKNNRLRGVDRMSSLEIVLEGTPPRSHEEKKALADEKNAAYRRLLDTMSEADVEPEVRSVLLELRRRGVKLAVGSSSKNAGFILSQTGLLELFDAVSDGNNITRSKPDPEVFLKAAQFISLPPVECAVVEDARAGIDAALAGGFLSVATGDAASYDKADVKLTCFSDILKLTEA